MYCWQKIVDATFIYRQFLPRDAMHKSEYAVARCLPSVCLSVRPSDTHLCCVETAKVYLNFFSPSDSHTIGWLRGTVGRTSVFDRRTFPVLRSTCS